MKDKIKLFEEFFWQTSDNEVANKIVNLLKKGIDVNKLRFHYGYVQRRYIYIINNTNNEIDPLGEENWGNSISIEVRQCTELANPFPYYKIIVHKEDEEIELKSNKGREIYMILHKAYKNKEKNSKKEKLKDLFK